MSPVFELPLKASLQSPYLACAALGLSPALSSMGAPYPRTGEAAYWTGDTEIDGQNPVEIGELDLIAIKPLPSHVWYQDMADFADGIDGSVAADVV